MNDAKALLEQLLLRRDLSYVQARELLGVLARAELPLPLTGALLAALRSKGVTAAELRGLADAMRAIAKKPVIPDDAGAIDIVGTGGDSSGSLNLSTGAALLTAACGVPVIKHGNRSVSSRSGSADLLERLGLAMPLDEAEAGACFARTGFTFLFAPYYHSAMKSLSAARSALGVKTTFNLLGPLTNPAAPRFYLIGAYDAAAARLIADTLSTMAIERAWVVHGSHGWDEATPLGPFQMFDVRNESVSESVVDPREFKIARAIPAALAGGDAAFNLAALRDVFEGRDTGAHHDALALQAGIAQHIAGHAASIHVGINRAKDALASGHAADWLRNFEAQGVQAGT